MSNFGTIKSKLLTKLTEAYTSENKSDAKNILKGIKSNRDLMEMYLFYEDIETKHIADKETATLFVEEVEKLLFEKRNTTKEICKSLNESLKDVVVESNELYECLDMLSEANTLLNIDSKVKSKKHLLQHLMTKKNGVVSESVSTPANESLLNAVLVNNFNVKYGDFLNEEQKETFKKITSLTEGELQSEWENIKSEINSKIDSMLSESTDSDLASKLETVKTEVNESVVNKYNYYRMTELLSGLN